MLNKKFQKNIENFNCEHCGLKVTGNGFTNHCPECLYSKHVDNNPGDRANNCDGLMLPVSIEFASQNYVIIHKCDSCEIEKKIKASTEDNIKTLIAISLYNATHY